MPQKKFSFTSLLAENRERYNVFSAPPSVPSFFFYFSDWVVNEETCVSYFRLASWRNGGELQSDRGCVGNPRAGI